MTATHYEWILARRPVGDIKDGDLVWRETPLPKAGDGEVVVRLLYLSLDPTNRVWMSDMDQYMPPVALGAPMRGIIMGQVVESKGALKVGQLVMGLGTWSEYVTGPASSFTVVPNLPGMTPHEVFGTMFLVGPTAYFGLMDLGQPKIGETLVVSTAAGAVGSIVVQLGKVIGCRVIGIAGGKSKCECLVKELGADGAIDYKSENVEARLRALCPNGIDIYFDNVGGEILNAVMGQMNLNGRIATCGLISLYQAQSAVAGPSNYPRILMKRLTVRGFVVLDFLPRYPEAYRALGTLFAQGKIKLKHQVEDGLQNADKAVRLLLNGGNQGKLLVKVADPA